jgi:hypothetical protein
VRAFHPTGCASVLASSCPFYRLRNGQEFAHRFSIFPGWKEGVAQAEQVDAQMDLECDARILAVLLVPRAIRPPGNYRYRRDLA